MFEPRAPELTMAQLAERVTIAAGEVAAHTETWSAAREKASDARRAEEVCRRDRDAALERLEKAQAALASAAKRTM